MENKSKAKKIFVTNVANKPFETKGYKLSDFIKAIDARTKKVLGKEYKLKNRDALEIVTR